MKILDVRELECGQRHALIFETFAGLAVGSGFELVNDHDPKPIRLQLQRRYPQQFTWKYLEQGPTWRIAIQRQAVGVTHTFQADDALKIHASPCATSHKMVDVRDIIPRDRHPLIFQTFDGLAAGESFELVNDHDPKPLYYQFLHERTDQFVWDYIEEGPDVWRVAIQRQAVLEQN